MNLYDRALPWLEREAGLGEPRILRRFNNGLSNVTLLVADADGRSFVLRCAPVGKASGGAHEVLREAKILAALRHSRVPVPAVIATCADVEVIGAPFYLMSHLDGSILDTAEAAATLPVERRHALGLELIEVMARLQEVDGAAVGLSWLSRTTPYLERQISRWSGQRDKLRQRSIPGLDDVEVRLRHRVGGLRAQPDVIVHGDYRLGNIMVNPSSGQVVGVLDWELTTAGHPLGDLAYLLARMQAPEEVLNSGTEPSAIPGFPSVEELVTTYSTRTGLPLADLDTLVAFNIWRWAIITEGVFQRLSRQQQPADLAWHSRRAPLLADYALRVMA